MRSLAFASAVLTLGACGTAPAEPEPADETSSTTDSGSSSTPSSSSLSSSTTEPDADTTDGLTTTGGFPPPVLDECIDDGSAGDHIYGCGDFAYDVTIPEICLEQPCGLIFDVHGFTMSGVMQEANTHLREHGAARGYIVVQPNANPAPPAATWNPGVDDEAVFEFMLRVADAFHVDRDRLHFTGFSQGGFMSWRMICDHADVLASVAPVAACGNGTVADCTFAGAQLPSEPIDILFLHGTDDVLVPFECVPVRRDAVIAAWNLADEELVADGDGYRWTRHEGADGTFFEVIVHEYSAENTVVLGGHCYPGSDDPGDAPGQLFSYACIDPGELSWGEVVLDFFDAHPRG